MSLFSLRFFFFPSAGLAASCASDHSPHQFSLGGSRGLRTQLHVGGGLPSGPGTGQQGGLADRLRPELVTAPHNCTLRPRPPSLAAGLTSPWAPGILGICA